MKKFKKLTSLILTFLFVATIFPKFNIEARAEILPAADLSVTLVGNIINDNGLGTDWEPANDQSLLKEYKNGIYEITVDFKAAKADGLYKVALNRNWDKSYGDVDGPEGNKQINVTAPGKVIFRFNSKTNEVFDSINNPDQFKTFASLVGTFAQSGGENWKPANPTFTLDYIGGGFYKNTFSLKAGTYEYKVAYNGAWDKGEVKDNVKLELIADTDVTFISNPIEGICTDSIANPTILGSLSLIGTIRGLGDASWDVASKDYDFTNLSGDGKYGYSGFFTAGAYEYKGIEDYAWAGDGLPASGNAKIAIPEGGKYVVFVADRASRTLVDSINNPAEVAEALGLQAPPEVPVVAKSPVLNANGSVTFNYQNIDAKQVYLAGDMTSWADNKKEMILTDAKNGIFSITLRLDDASKDYEYKFIVDGKSIKDPSNISVTGDNSIFAKPENTGRKVVLAGTIQGIDGSGTWDPASDKTKLNYDGNGNYSLTIKDVPAGNYEYKIAMGSWDPENYGANGVPFGANISLIVPVQEDVIFWYNDDSHNIVDSTYYKVADIDLKGTGISVGTKLIDPSLSGIYNAKVTLNKGTYSNVVAVLDGKEYTFGTIDITDATKDVTFSFDATTLMTFTDASTTPIAVNSLYFNSRDSKYKSPYGATPTDTEITFNLKTGKDITSAKIVLITPIGIKLVDMTEGVAFDANSNKWTGNFESSKIGQYKYYFVVSNGSDVKAYGDDGFFGPGKAGQIGTVGYYDLNIYDKNFKTPNWMKNAVVYQIFPDRFFNGDTSNDNAQKLARGASAYENYSDWYAIPEDPTLEFIANEDGTQSTERNPDYKGTKGDGVWANEMYGGDIKGIKSKLDYLQAVGINTLYMTPISASISNHRYDATDYKELDPLLGHMDEFVSLATEAHSRGMHLIIDGVFNHVSDDSIYFDRYGKYMTKNKPIGAYQYWSRVYDLMNLYKVTQQVAEKQVTSDLASQGITDLHYKDWFVINNTKVAAVTGDPEHYGYEGWAGYDSMPVVQALNGSEYNLESWADEIIDGPDANTRLWLQNGSNGWRLDVANEVSDETWRNFRTAVKEEGDNVIIGEIWSDASKYLLGDMYDSVMNYRFRDAVLAYVENKDEGNMSAVQAMNQLEAMREQYPKEAFEVMMNLVDSHDTQRIISDFDGAQKSVKAIAGEPSEVALQKVRLIPLIQMTYPGAPTIYYGDEAAIPGADDPDNRRGMIWGKGDKSTVEWYAKLTNIRNEYSVLRTGDIVPITIDGANKVDVLAYSRNNENNHAVIAINRKATAINGVVLTANAPVGTVLTNALDSTETYTVDANGKVTVDLPEYSGVILVAEYTAVVVKTEDLTDVYDETNIVLEKTNDITVLSSALAAAQTLREEAKIGTAVGNVPQAAVDTFQNVINVANTKIIITQEDEDDQVAALAIATTNFKSAIILVTPPVVTPPVATPELTSQRLSGLNRIETSIAIAKKLYSDTKPDAVVLATADKFADALAGSGLAYKYNAPMLLVNKTVSNSKNVLDYVKANLNKDKNIYILGETGAVSSEISDYLIAQGYKVIRLGGSDRYVTNQKIVENLNVTKGTSMVIATGTEFADALSISSIAAKNGLPILLNGKDNLSSSVSSYITKLQPTTVYVVGGEGVLSANIETQIKKLNVDIEIVRLGGANRYETSLKIAEHFNLVTTTITVATGKEFPDALTGSVLAARANSSILLVDNKDVTKQKALISKQNITNVIVLGGEGAISAKILKSLMQK
ncbi:cell wall-binding repeat-containing protein [Clostridium sp.]|uniref:cell wall-binding repeat-containing protein n=1 Tax=Clostridium sp. TaxID=1506 RepID=UPI003D6D3396